MTFIHDYRTCAFSKCICSRSGHSETDRMPSCLLIFCSCTSSSVAVLSTGTRQINKSTDIYASRQVAEFISYLAHTHSTSISLREPRRSRMIKQPVAQRITVDMRGTAAFTRFKHHCIPVVHSDCSRISSIRFNENTVYTVYTIIYACV